MDVYRLFFIWIWWVFFNEFLRKSLSEKGIALLCSYYLSWHHRNPKVGNFKFLTFIIHPILMHFFFGKMIIIIGYWWAINYFAVLFPILIGFLLLIYWTESFWYPLSFAVSEINSAERSQQNMNFFNFHPILMQLFAKISSIWVIDGP